MKRILFSLICICLLGTGLSAQKIYLVSVGIADYPGTQNDLTLPAKDATTIQWLYQKNKKAETVLLTNTQATRSNVLNSMERLFAKASTNDIVVLFFSGHGYKGGFVGYDDRLSYQDVRQAMAKSSSKNKMIFADACFSGKMRGAGRSSSSLSPASLKVMLFLSSRDTEVSFERSSMQNGFFTTSLQRGLRGGADTNRDRIITAQELFQFVSQGVKELSNDKQHPVMWGKFDHSMPVMIW